MKVFLRFLVLSSLVMGVHGGTLTGYLRDQNWYARYQSNPLGVGYYEYGINANGQDLSSTGGADDTDVFGVFQMNNLPAGSYTVVSWDVWWRSAYVFGVAVPSSGTTPTLDLRLKATMWGYPAFWDDSGYHEFGQTFVATGPVSMIYLRAPLSTSYTLTMRENGPGGAQVGASRSFNGGDQRLIYGYGDMPTVAGRTYYARIRTSSPSVGGVIMQMDPRPDYSDPMPGGCLWLGNGTVQTPYLDRDLGLVIMSDDDGLVTDLFVRPGGTSFSGVTSVGQTFTARGVGLISAAAWLADPAVPVYVVRVLEGGPGGAQTGTSKRGRPARLGADPEMIVAWAPGECPLVPGQQYYLEVARDGGGTFNSVYVNAGNTFPFGQAYRDGVAVAATDLAGTLMEEAAVGSALQRTVALTVEPSVADQDRGTTTLTVRWTTDVPSDSSVEYALDQPPYTMTNYNAALVTQHTAVLSGLRSHSLYHYRVRSGTTNYRSAISRDNVICTRPVGTNWLVNPGFEEGTGPSPRTLAGWTKSGGVDTRMSDGTWFHGLPFHSGAWFLQGAVNGGNSDGYIYQRVTGVASGQEYTFSAWVTTWPRENNTLKYDVWQDRNRLIYMRLGIDPTGGVNPNASSVQWTPRMYSHLRYSNLAKSAVAQGSALTVFVSMKGDGVQWHLYGLDDCVLTPAENTGLAMRDQTFDVVPPWTSVYDDPAGSAADFAIVIFGETGNGLQATRTMAGSSARVLVVPVATNTTYVVSISARAPSSSANYLAEVALKSGRSSAEDYVNNSSSWNALQRFSNPGPNGNGNRWERYPQTIHTETNVEWSVGFKLESNGGAATAVRWDTLRFDPIVLPVLSITREGDRAVLSWEPLAGVLEGSPDLTAPWTPWAEQTSPVIITPTNGMRFFRVTVGQ